VFTTHLGGGMMRLQNLKTKMKNLKLIRLRITNSILLLIGGVLTLGIVSSPIVSADSYSAQIQALQNINNQAQSSVSSLQSQATTYQQALSQLQSEIAGIQAQIQATQDKVTSTQDQIQANDIKLAQEKSTLDNIIKSMYVNGNLSTLEMLATSNNLSDFVTKEEYQNIVQNQIQSTLATINATQATLNQQKTELSSLLTSQETMNNQLVSSQSQENQLLSYNQSQQDQYSQQIKSNNSKISQLQAEQAAAERSTFSGSASATGGSLVFRNLTGQQMCGGGYNFHCGDTQDNYLDQWGEYNRECVSYAAWYEGNIAGHYVPAFGYTLYGGAAQGNAYQWGGVIRNTGAATIMSGGSVSDTSTLVGSVVYMPIGSLGHVGVVLSDEGGGWVRVGQYNLYDEGMYSEMDLKVTSNLSFYVFN
jgi:peptidoglycan hydrolase CwlO-like protein